MFLGSGLLMLAQAGGGDGWMGAVLQGGALLLLAGVLWVIFKEVAPRLLEEMRSQQDARHKEHLDFVNALSALRESHLVEMDRARKSHEAIIKNLGEQVMRCEYRQPHDKKHDKH